MRFFLAVLLLASATHAAPWDFITARATGQLPRIAFDAEPRTTGGPLSLVWTIHAGTSPLARADVWRAPYAHDCQENNQLGCITAFVAGKAAPDVAEWTDSVNDSLSGDGNYLYLLYVSDREGRVAMQSLRVSKSGGAPVCTDTDGGKDYYAQGTVTACSVGNTACRLVSDSCYGSLLTEWSCSGVSVAHEAYACPNGCERGACTAANGSVIVYLSTDKKTYRISEGVQIAARAEGLRGDVAELRPVASVRRPDGRVDDVPLSLSEPCDSAPKCAATYAARYDRADTTGRYAVDGINLNARTKFVIGSSFNVFDKVEQYLILRNIGNAAFAGTETSENEAYTAYFAAYNDSGKLVVGGVAEYRSGEQLDKDFDEFLRRNADKLERKTVAGNVVYEFRDPYEHMAVWRRGSRALFVIQYAETKELDIGTALRPPSFSRVVRKATLFSDIVSAVNLDPDNGITISRLDASPSRVQAGDVVTLTAVLENNGNRTARDLTAELVGVSHLWRDSRGTIIEDMQPQGPFVLRPPAPAVPGDARAVEWKLAAPHAKAQYQVTVGVTYSYDNGDTFVADRSVIITVDGTGTRPQPQLPLPVVLAYLGKYPSDVAAAACEANGGSCSQSCRKGYAPLAYSCPQGACCARSLTAKDVRAMRDTIESLEHRLGKLQEKAFSMAGEDERYHPLAVAALEARKTATQLLEGLIQAPERTDAHRVLFNELKAQVEQLGALTPD